MIRLHTHDSSLIQNQVRVPPEESLSKIVSLPLYNLTFTDPAVPSTVGFVSQDVHAQYPEQCHHNNQKFDAEGKRVCCGQLSHNVNHLSQECCNAISALHAQVQALKASESVVVAQQTEIVDLKAQLALKASESVVIAQQAEIVDLKAQLQALKAVVDALVASK